MKKLFIILSIVLVSLLLLNFFVSAHSGKTDSNGGHYDHSTGEYHYHHGYPAHSHYDVDGDGRKDCPYKFDDKTNSGSSSSGKYNDNITFQKVMLSLLMLIPIGFVSAGFIYILSYILLTIIRWICKNVFGFAISEDKENTIIWRLFNILLISTLIFEFILLLKIT